MVTPNLMMVGQKLQRTMQSVVVQMENALQAIACSDECVHSLDYKSSGLLKVASV